LRAALLTKDLKTEEEGEMVFSRGVSLDP
jgi:hypothetical protein